MASAPEEGEPVIDAKTRKVSDELIALATMGMDRLRAKYAEVFDEQTTSHNAAYLRKKIAWRTQELAFGGLSERVQARLDALARNAPLRQRPPAADGPVAQRTVIPVSRDPRIPPPGDVLRREYAGVAHEVTVADGGFVYRGVTYASLSMVAKVITGTTWNGMLFFGLAKRKRKEAA
jgi:hypothetical protein